MITYKKNKKPNYTYHKLTLQNIPNTIETQDNISGTK